MALHLVAISMLVFVFVIGTVRPVNIGALGLAATFIVGSLAVGESLDDMLAGFPADLFVLLVGVTYLFSVASANGTVDWLVRSAARLTHRQTAVIPWLVFAVSAVATTAGALGPATVALVAPIALRLATEYRIDRRMIGLMVIHGSACGNFSPLNALGAIVNQTVTRSGLEASPIPLFLANVAYNFGLGVAIFLIFGGRGLVSRGKEAVAVAAAGGAGGRASSPSAGSAGRVVASSGVGEDGDVEDSPRTVRMATLLGIAVVAVASLALGLDIAIAALVVAVALHMVFPSSSAGADRKIAWGVVLLICGLVTYVALLQRIGTVDAIGRSIAELGSPLLAAFLLCLIGAIASAFASSAGMLAAVIPLSIPFLAAGDIGVAGMIVALSIATTAVDATPFSTVGALVVANSSETERKSVYHGLLRWGVAMVVTAPILTWLLFVLPFSG